MIEGGTPLHWPDPLQVLLRWPADRPVVLLHSGRVDPRWSRWSCLAEPDGWFRVDAAGRSRWIGDGPSPIRHFEHRPFSDLRRMLASSDAPWIGYLSYDLARWIERLPARAADDRQWPLIELARCPGLAVFDGLDGTWRAAGRWADSAAPALGPLPIEVPWSAGDPVSVFTRDQYESAVARSLAYIGAGDAFQINLAQRFSAAFHGDGPRATRSLFARLAEVSPAWYGAYVECAAAPQTGRALASISPELFLHLTADGRVTTRPIKGTRPSSVDPELLRRSEKDGAELNMIVDLLRNDLGRVCRYGSVRVVEPRCIETHPTIHHGVATIEGRLHGSKDVVDLLRAAMPGGSITGAPKVRAMQIIEQLEPVRRGPYCGCIGLLSANHAHLNIAIRTLALDPGQRRLDYSVGGGIVADSDPAAEYEETLDKAAAIRAALAAPAAVGADHASPWPS